MKGAAPNGYKHLTYARQQVGLIITNSSVVVQFICTALVLFYLLTFFNGMLDHITVTPGHVIPPEFRVWTYLTHSFVEQHLWFLIVDITVVILAGKLLEPLWGAFEMAIFCFCTNTIVAVLTFFVYLCAYYATKDERLLFRTHIHGLAGYIAGFSVAVKQIMPDQILLATTFGKLRNRHIPSLLFLLVVGLFLTGLVNGPFTIMFMLGLPVSWIYLRFYQKHANGNRGDQADAFSFASFFPPLIQPVVQLIGNSLFNFLVTIKVCQKPRRRYDVGGMSNTITITLPGADTQDAERRRQRALKALDDRLGKGDESLQWPSLAEGDTDLQQPTGSTTPVTPDASVPTPGQTPATGSSSKPQHHGSTVVDVEAQAPQTSTPTSKAATRLPIASSTSIPAASSSLSTNNKHSPTVTLPVPDFSSNMEKTTKNAAKSGEKGS